MNSKLPTDSLREWLREQPVLTRDVIPEDAVRWDHARNVFLAWLPLVALMFLLATVLTYWVAFYEARTPEPIYVAYLLRDARPVIDEAELSSGQRAVRAVVSYIEPGGVPALSVRITRKGYLLFSDLRPGALCTIHGHSSSIVTLPVANTRPQLYRALIPATPGRTGQQVVAECPLSRGASDETFAHRVLHLSNDVPAAAQLKGYTAQVVRMNVADVEGTELVTLRGGLADPGIPEARIVPPHDELHAKWRQTVHEERRDVILVIIGTLIALGAAMLIEAMRPWIDLHIHELRRTSETGSGS